MRIKPETLEIARTISIVAAVWIGVATPSDAADTWTDPYPGIRHLHRDTSNQQIHVLLVDLSHPELRVRATRSEDRGATVSGFAEQYGLAAAINGDFWQADVYTTSGLSVADGTQWPDENDNTTEGFIAIGVDNTLSISAPAEVLETPEAWMSEVVGGRPLVAEGGIAIDPSDCAPHFCELHPRTAVGVSADGKTLVLAAIDGRSSIAAGMTSRQVGELMVEMGAEVALNFDGGGSTAMFVGSEGGVVNVPSDGSERVVANHLGIEIVEPIGTLHGTVLGSDGTVVAGAMVQLSTGAMTVTDAEGFFELVDVAAGDTIASAIHESWLPGDIALWVSAQETTQADLVLEPRPPAGATSDEGSSETSGEPAPGESGSSIGDALESSGDDTDVDPTEHAAPGESAEGCGCTTDANGGWLPLGALVGIVVVRRRRRIAAATFLAAATGCAAPPTEPAEPPSTTSVRFAPVADGPLDFGAVPFPSDLHRDDDGRIAIGALPNPRSDDAMFDAVRSELAQRTGFCTSCNITFVIDGEVLEDTLPQSAEPGTEASLDDAVVLVDVDPESPELGRTFPLRVQFDPMIGRLSARPARGAVLHGGRSYAAVLTTNVRGADDLPLAAAPEFASVRAGDTGEGALERAVEILEPTLATLDELGLDRDRIAGLAAFTTEDPRADLQSIRETLYASAAPIAIVDQVWSGTAIDELLGTPASPGPGVDRQPAEGTEGSAAIAHETTAFVVSGRFVAPRFVAGEGTDVGGLVRDADGRPTATASDEVPFVLVIPRDADLSRLPVVVSHHGFNASRTTGFVLSDTAGAAGFAVLAIDAYQHGARAATANDQMHAMRGLGEPDGFAETSTFDVSARVFGLSGGPTDMTLFPGYPLAAFEQFTADVMTTVRFVREGDISALRAADPALADLSFDGDRIAYVGNSMGAVVGTAVAVTEPDIHAFVLDVMPGSIVETLAESGEFRPLMDLVLLPQLGVDEEFDEVDRALLFDPTVDLVRWVLEPVDPLALAPYLVHSRATATPDLLVQLAGHDEVAAPTTSESVVAAAGIPGHGAFGFAAVEPAMMPVSANLGGSTIAAVRFDAAMHGMLEVSRQSSKWAEPLEPPLVMRDATSIDNPIVAVHEQIEVFLATYREDGRATIVP